MDPISLTATGPAYVAPAVPAERHFARLHDPFHGSLRERQPVAVQSEGHLGDHEPITDLSEMRLSGSRRKGWLLSSSTRGSRKGLLRHCFHCLD